MLAGFCPALDVLGSLGSWANSLRLNMALGPAQI